MAASPVPIQLDVTTDETPSETIVRFAGRITLETTEKVKTTVKPLLARSKRVVLDFENVKYMDSSGIGTIVGLYASAKAASCQLKLVNVSDKGSLSIIRLWIPEK